LVISSDEGRGAGASSGAGSRFLGVLGSGAGLGGVVGSGGESCSVREGEESGSCFATEQAIEELRRKRMGNNFLKRISLSRKFENDIRFVSVISLRFLLFFFNLSC